jgi:hypothetical protein
MQRRRLRIGLIVVIVASALLAYWLLPQPQGIITPETPGNSDTSPGPLLVVPEVPLGTLGLLIAFLAALLVLKLPKRSLSMNL